MVKLHGDNAWRPLPWITFFVAILFWGRSRALVPRTGNVPPARTMGSRNHSTKADRDTGFTAGGVREKYLTGSGMDSNQQAAFGGERDPIQLPRLLSNQRLLSGILPISDGSLEDLEQILGPLLDPGAIAMRDIVLVLPGPLRPRVSEVLLRVLAKHVGHDHPEISLKTWDVLGSDLSISPSILRFLDPKVSSWALVMDYDGLRKLDKDTRAALLGEIVDWGLPYGPRGSPLNSSTLPVVNSRQWTHISRSRPVLASRLEPPFILPLDLLGAKTLPHTWHGLSKQVALCNSWNASGLLIGRHLLPVAVAHPELSTPTPASPSAIATLHLEGGLRFDIILSDATEVLDMSPLLCGLLARGHTLRTLIVDTKIHFSFSPIRRKTRLVTGIAGCELDFFTVNQYMRRKQLFKTIDEDANSLGAPHVVITLKAHSFADFLIENVRFGGNVLIELPRADIPFCDWMASMSLQEWQSWAKPRVDISVITRDRPHSLSRLLRSLSSAKFYGDSIDLRINIEQDCDFETLEIGRNFSWPYGRVFLHRRVVHAGLLPAIVESWFPRDNDTYGLLLEDDVEVSPMFYAWVKMSILKYRYGSTMDHSPKLFGISLYQQKNVELRPEGRIPFHARELFANHGLPFPSTPYLSQVPCSWGAVYFPEHWSEFHHYLLSRFSESWISMGELVVLPYGVRSNHWLRSWKKYFIELAYLNGYVMLYPNYEGYLSLSTNHLEYGAHVKTRTKEKRDLFDQPLFPLPVPDSNGMPGETGLLDLPGRMLPRYRDLPILNLTASLTTAEDLIRIGEGRRLDLVGVTSKGQPGSGDVLPEPRTSQGSQREATLLF